MDDIYRENKELNKSDVEEILTWINNQSHLPKITEYEAAIFLHARYYELTETKKLIEMYFTHRTKNPSIFGNRDAHAEEVKLVTDNLLFIPFSKPLCDGSSALLVTLLDDDAKKFNCKASLRVGTMMVDWWHMNHGFSSSASVVVNMKGASLGHLIRLSIMSLRVFVPFAQEYVPLRIKHIHFINTNRLTQRFIGVIKPFLKKEIIDLMCIHTTMESAYEYIPRENFPAELGGTWKTFAELQQDMKEILTKNSKYFLEEDTERAVNESLRIK
uniref:Putative alpha-tocopherol transfer protein n=1 Tax=Nyssomyia neivai TaxID=330878 RepID=A0A1L8DAJ9_9DIPT